MQLFRLQKDVELYMKQVVQVCLIRDGFPAPEGMEKMNYIKELNAFYQQITFEPLSGAAVALWNTLMHFNNRCGWRKQFSVAAGILELTAGIRGGTFQRARAELQEKGFITVTKRSGNRAALYQMISQIQVFDDNGCFIDDREYEGKHLIGDAEKEDGAAAKTAQGEALSQREIVPQEEKERDVPHPDVAGLGEVQTDTTTEFGDLADGKQMENNVKRQQDGAAVSRQTADNEHFYKVSDGEKGKNHIAASSKNHMTVPMMDEKGMDKQAMAKPEHNRDRSLDNSWAGKGEDSPDDKVGRNVDDSSVHSADALYKHRRKRDETIQDETIRDKTVQTITTTAAVDFYEANLGRISPYVQENMLSWIQELGEELVVHAMKRTLEQNKTTWSYVQGILKAWSEKGIVNMQQAEADSAAFRESNRGGKNQVNPKSSGVVPDWWEERKREKEQQRKEKENAVPEPVVPAEDDEEWQELLKEYGLKTTVTG